MANMVLVMVDECGDEREAERFNLSLDLDEDEMEIWQDRKISKYRERYPEARRFYFEDRRHWNSLINMCMADPTFDPTPYL